MLKRVLVLFLALLLAAACLPAAAEANVPPVYRIVLRTEAGDETLGSGVLFRSADTLLTVQAVLRDGSLYAAGADGEFALRYAGQIIGTGLALLTLDGRSSAVPLELTASATAALTLYGADAQGAAAWPVTLARTDADENYGSVLLSSAEGLLPGAVLLGEDGGIAAIVTSQRGEGRGVYEALTGTAMASALGGVRPGAAPEAGNAPAAGETPAAAENADAGLVYEVFASYADGAVTLDWTDSAGYPEGDDVYFSVFFSIGANLYYNYIPVPLGATVQKITVPPGKNVFCWVAYSRGEHVKNMMPGDEQDALAVVDTGKVMLQTDNGYRNVSSSVTVAAPGLSAEPSLPLVPLTREALADERLTVYYQTEDTYQVTQASEDHLLLLTLYTPEGYVFCEEGRYSYMPELCASDAWVYDVGALFDAYLAFGMLDDGLPAGEYKVICYIDGKLGGGAVFTLP